MKSGTQDVVLQIRICSNILLSKQAAAHLAFTQSRTKPHLSLFPIFVLFAIRWSLLPLAPARAFLLPLSGNNAAASPPPNTATVIWTPCVPKESSVCRLNAMTHSKLYSRALCTAARSSRFCFLFNATKPPAKDAAAQDTASHSPAISGTNPFSISPAPSSPITAQSSSDTNKPSHVRLPNQSPIFIKKPPPICCKSILREVDFYDGISPRKKYPRQILQGSPQLSSQQGLRRPPELFPRQLSRPSWSGERQRQQPAHPACQRNR